MAQDEERKAIAYILGIMIFVGLVFFFMYLQNHNPIGKALEPI